MRKDRQSIRVKDALKRFAKMREAWVISFTSRILNCEPDFDFRSPLLVVCVTIASSYLVPTVAGMLVSNPQTVWPLWPGCAILVTGLLLVRVNVWPIVISASFA